MFLKGVEKTQNYHLYLPPIVILGRSRLKTGKQHQLNVNEMCVAEAMEDSLNAVVLPSKVSTSTSE